MLTELHIENLGVIERVELTFGPGLTAVTGETGAGKTMLVEAIELLVGGRADTSIVRHGAAEARIDGRFVTADGGERVLTRVIPADGRSRAYLDGRLATVASLADVAADIVDLHGQHAHQSLLSTATQRAALDDFAGIDLEPLRSARARLTEIDAELAALGGDERARAREIDLLRFQVDELDAAAIVDPDEDAALDSEETVLADATAHRDAAVAAVAALGDDGERAMRWPRPSVRSTNGHRSLITCRGCATCWRNSTISSPRFALTASRSKKPRSASPRYASAARASRTSVASTATTSPR